MNFTLFLQIFAEILKYLDLDDFKALRETCKTLNNEVLRNKSFKNVSTFVISKSSVKKGILWTAVNRNELKHFRFEEIEKSINTADRWNLLWTLLNSEAEFIDFTETVESRCYMTILKEHPFTPFSGTIREDNFIN